MTDLKTVFQQFTEIKVSIIISIFMKFINSCYIEAALYLSIFPPSFQFNAGVRERNISCLLALSSILNIIHTWVSLIKYILEISYIQNTKKCEVMVNRKNNFSFGLRIFMCILLIILVFNVKPMTFSKWVLFPSSGGQIPTLLGLLVQLCSYLNLCQGVQQRRNFST